MSVLRRCFPIPPRGGGRLKIAFVLFLALTSLASAEQPPTSPKPFDPSKQEPEPWTNMPEIIPFANSDGSFEVAWRDNGPSTPKLYRSRFVRNGTGFKRASTEELPSLGLLAGFTKDDKGNVYYLTGERGQGETQKRMVLYKNKQPFWTFQMQDSDDGPGQLPKLPLDNGTSRIVTGAGKLLIDINLLPAHAYNVILDLENPSVNKARCARETLWHHNFDQRILFDGKDFVTIENRDHEMTLSMMKFSPTEKYPFEPYGERLRSVYTRTNTGNSNYTELGDIAPGVDDGNGYLVLFASERDWDYQMEGVVSRGNVGIGNELAPRDLAVVHVRKDFDRQAINWKGTASEKEQYGNLTSQAPKLVDTTGVVNSLGTGKTVTYKAKNDGWDWGNYNPDIARLIASGELAKRQYKTGGVNWLTGYGAASETKQQLPIAGTTFATISHPKLTRIAPNRYIALWEEYSGSRVAGDMIVIKSYKTTKAVLLTLTAEGESVRITHSPVKDLGKIRLMAFDDAFLFEGKAAWVTGDETTNSLRLHLVDDTLNYQTFGLPLR